MARVLQYICAGLVIGILSVLVNIHPAAAVNCDSAANCQNGGTCPNPGTAVCSCGTKYSGDACETATCGNATDCNSKGTCGGTPKICTCNSGYGGKHCETAPVCKTDADCGDHGTCDTSTTTHKCTCTDNYTGTKCATAPKSSSPAVRLSLMSLVVSSIVYFIVQ